MRGMSMREWLRRASPLVVLFAVAACGDADTGDPRGYTKAPLEEPGVIIKPEKATEMDELGDPIRPPIVDLTPGEEAAGGKGQAPAGPS